MTTGKTQATAMLTQEFDTHRRTFDLGMRALAHIKQHRTSAEPIAYEVWYEHVTGHHQRLSEDVKARAEKGMLSDSDLRDLHANYLSSLRVSERIEEIGAGAKAEMQDLLSTVRSTIGNLAAMDSDLQQTADRLSQTGFEDGDLKALLDTAAGTTRKVCETNASLEAKLVASEASIASLQLALEEARGAAMTDPLTSLFNRRAFDEQYRTRFDRANTDDLPLCVLMLDIDHFKVFNDSHGHAVGDQVIRLVGSCIKQRLGPPDLPARYGGEEFAIVSLGRPLSGALEVAEDIRRKIDGYEIVKRGTQQSLGKVTVSIGIASLKPDDTPASLLERADQCLYLAKRTGRNRVSADLSAN